MAWAVAATLLATATATLWVDVKSNHQYIADTNGDQVERPAEAAPVLAELASTVQLSYISPDTHLQGEIAGPQASFVSAGENLLLTEGEIELTYSTGTKLLLIGPAEFLVEAAGGKLRSGGLVASVTDEGHGFTIETPNGKVVDLGTEFGVVVDDFGVSEVSVFQGKVEAFPLGNHIDAKKIELTKGRGLQWNEDDLIPLDVDFPRFAASVLHRRTIDNDSEVQSFLHDEFRNRELDLAKWKSLGAVQPSTRGLRLVGDGDVESQPYLITAGQYDPSQGPITVTCDFRFAELESASLPTFSILTRSADERGTAPHPWSGALAACVRCSFGSDEQSGEGRLQTGVKLEGDREMANISWSGFLSPAAGTPYRVVMRDDGIKVSFTVSLRDNPSISKTVTCRSLFQGKANYVALEGAGLGTTLIERVEISRDQSPTPLSSYADFSSLLPDLREQLEVEKQIWSDWTPQDAVLVIQDQFDTEQLDASKWMSLGDVVAGDGAVQLGLPNADAQIDTWKPRPYLLTSEPLDLNAGALTILGKITFADNFLAGYGASFAVMTRADDERGQGPGWEHSVLQRGVRSNFWPSAWDLEHSLEIHEKPASNTLTLLATQGVQVNPRARSYLFRVVDDGQSVTLTIVDPRRPSVTSKIAASTTSNLRNGYVGFESCWGSPVTLDDVAIYQHRRSTHNAPVSPNDK